jgi:hypothetical protein
MGNIKQRYTGLAFRVPARCNVFRWDQLELVYLRSEIHTTFSFFPTRWLKTSSEIKISRDPTTGTYIKHLLMSLLTLIGVPKFGPYGVKLSHDHWVMNLSIIELFFVTEFDLDSRVLIINELYSECLIY